MIKVVLENVNDVAKVISKMDIPNVSAICELIDTLIVTDEEKKAISEKLALSESKKVIDDNVGNSSIEDIIQGANTVAE